MRSADVLMNRRAVALAADSATTASRWVRGERKTRYFKGANKLFHLSISDPVGLMINGSGNLQGVPWDVLIKSFRDHLGQTSYPHLKDYGKKFFEWLEKNTDAFPMEFLAKQFVAEALSCAYGIAYPGFRAVKDADGADREKKKEILSSEFESEAQSVSAAQLLANAKKKDVESAIKELGEAVGKELEKHRVTAGLCGVVGTEKLANVAIEAVFKAGHSSLDDTGIIVTGFGNKEYFASVES